MSRPPAPRVRPRALGAPAPTAERERERVNPQPAVEAPDQSVDLSLAEDEFEDDADWEEADWDDPADEDFDGEADLAVQPTLALAQPAYAAAGARVLEQTAAPRPEHLMVRELGRAVRAGLEALVASWLIVVVPVVAGYVATVAAPVLGEASWLDAARGGTSLWLLGFGQPLAVADAVTGTAATVTLVPIGLTALTVALLAGGVRRGRIGSPPGLLVTALSAGAVLAGGYALAGVTPTPRGVLTAVGAVVLGCAIGRLRLAGVPAPWRTRLPDPVRESARRGLQAGLRVGVAVAALAAVVLAVSVLAHAGAIAQVHRDLGPDFLSGALLGLAQLAAVPTFAVWVLAWLAGPGFEIGAVSVTPVEATAGPLPVLPVLAAIPDAGPGPGRIVVLGLVVVIAAALLRPLLACRSRGELAAVAGIAVVLLAVGGGALAALSSGAIGPLTSIGPHAWAVTGALTLVGALGALLAAGAALGLRAAGIDHLPALPRLRLPRLRSRGRSAR